MTRLRHEGDLAHHQGERANMWQEAFDDLLWFDDAIEAIEQIHRHSRQVLEKQQRLLTGVQDDLTQARMQPIGEILSRLPRTLEQLAKTQGKPVELTIRGDKVLVDKAIAQKLYDPLLHLVRNAVAHGIEDNEVRQMRGKPAAGQIEIRAYNQGNRTIIEVKDDGQGIDYDRIRKRAIERKLVSASQASKLSVPQLLEFIFQPSFSTTTKVDELSGRGVGLDVVRSQLQTVQGSISISSEWEKGTTFYLQLPLTLSIAKLLVCYAGDRAYAFPSDNVEQIVLLQRSQVKTIGNQRVMQWQQEYKVPLRRLSDLLRFAPGNLPWRRSNGTRTTTAKNGSSFILLLRSDCGLVGLEVDRVAGEQELVIRSLGDAIAPPAYVYGCTILGDSNLALAIDALMLVNMGLQESGTFAEPASLTITGEASPVMALSAADRVVMVVDDSITMRQRLSLTLQRAGYRVLQAKDGQDAIQQLHQNPAVGMVISDLEMPEMNGLELLGHCQKDTQLSQIPVLILTSNLGEQNRQLALALGAAGYMNKPFVESELLRALQEVKAQEEN